jgi:hypothetical protein
VPETAVEENKAVTAGHHGQAMRVDNLVRTERYFCALLLSLLTDEAFTGVPALIKLLAEKSDPGHVLATVVADHGILPGSRRA